MKRLIYYFIITIVFNSLIYSQQDYKISGFIYDHNSQTKLARVNIFCKELNKTVSSDEEGAFIFDNISSGDYSLIFSRIGYKKLTEKISVNKDVTGLKIYLNEIALPGQTVIVTAMRGEKRNTPMTFSNLEQEELEKRYTVQDIPVLLSELPSTTFYSESGNGIGYNYLNIRGFDQRRISVMINGVPQNEPEDHNIYWLDFPDIAANLDNIQVQRGAGSAFYGPASVGGSINLITSNFSNKRGMSLSAGIGDYNTKKYSFSVNSGIIGDKYSFYGRLSRISSSGYRDNSWSQLNSFFLGGIRYDENLTTQIHIYGGPISDHLAYYGIPKEDINDRAKRKANPIQRQEEIENFSQPHYELLQEWKINDNLTFNHTLFFIEGEGFFIYDASWADSSYFRLNSQFGFSPTQNPSNALVKANVHNKQYGWMPRLNYNHSNGELTLGLELRNHRSLHWGGLHWAENLPEGLTPDYRYYEYKGGKDMFSAYAHEIYHVNAEANLLVNLQYSYNKYRIYDEKYIGTDFSVPYHFFNPLVGFNYNINENINSYVTMSYISREPKLNNLYDAGAERDGATPQFESNTDGTYNFDKPLVKPERLFDIEVGLAYNSEIFSSTLNLFWMDFNDEIVKSGKLDRFGQPVTGNAEKTRHLGMEITAQYKILDELSLSGNFTLSKNKIVKNNTFMELYNPVNDKYEMTAVALNGNRISGFPDLLGNLRLNYEFNNLSASILMQCSGDKYTDNFGDLEVRSVKDNKVDAFTVFNFDLTYKIPALFGLSSIDAKLQINNLFDKLYANQGEGSEFFPAAERNAFFSLQFNL